MTLVWYPPDSSLNVAPLQVLILIDGEEKKSASFSEDFNPPFQPTEEIDDPEDKKPTDWVDVARIPDPEATKPEDWDEDAPLEIPDEVSGWQIAM